MSVGVIGLGYVGVPVVVALAEAGRDVVGVDIDADVVGELAAGRSRIEDVDAQRLAAVAQRTSFTTSYEDLAGCEEVLLCVPTPLSPNREPDLGPLRAASASLAEVLRAGQLVVLESTSFPGTTREELAPVLEGGGLVAGRDFNLAYSPERVDPGSGRPLGSTPRVVGGLTEACARRAAQLYGAISGEVVVVSTPEVAELSKLVENIFRSVNIAMVNELAILAHRMGIDIWEAVDAAATKPFGFMRFDPGPGMGGHCLPIDPFYLSWKAREYDFSAEFIELAGRVNQEMPRFCVERVARTLSDGGKPLRDARVLIVGVAYKDGVADLRESPALRIMQLLAQRGARISYHDPHVAALEDPALRSEELESALADCDIAVIVTAHTQVDHERIARSAPLTLDLRGVTRGVDAEGVARL